ncbi:MAG: ATP-binding protein [Pseudomonadota bacterium]
MSSAHFRISSEYENVGTICADILQLVSANVSEQKANEVHIGLSEALNNVIEHSYQERSGQPIEVECNVDPSAIVINISDFGNGMSEDAFLARPAELCIDDPDDLESLPEGGMGIALIKSCMDKTSYSRGGREHGNRLTLVKNR